MSELRKGLPPLPARMRSLRVSDKGYPVPYFVAWIDGQPDFRVIEGGRIAHCHNRKLCWLCGEPLGRWKAFVVGPMCLVNMVSSEPPSHRECAEYAAKACPFLTLPKAQRREANMPAEGQEPAGVALKRNPGCCLLLITDSYRPFRVENGVLFRMGDPSECLWFAEGRAATRAEVMSSIDSGLPLLRGPAQQQDEAEPGAGAVQMLELMLSSAMVWVPA